MAETAREVLDVDVVFVGAGPANLAAAIHLGRMIQRHNEGAAKKLEVSLAIFEKGKEIGSHALSGAVVDPRAMVELFPDEWQQAPFEGKIEDEELWWMTASKAFKMPIPPMLDNRGKYVASLGRLLKWMETKLEDAGVDLFCEFPATEVLLEGERVIGIRTGDKGLDHHGKPKANYEPGVDVHARAVVLGEGPRGPWSNSSNASWTSARARTRRSTPWASRKSGSCLPTASGQARSSTPCIGPSASGPSAAVSSMACGTTS